jgi:predicted peptidase
MKTKTLPRLLSIIFLLGYISFTVHGQTMGYKTGKGVFESFIFEYPENIKKALNKMYPHYVVCKPSIIAEGDKLPLIIHLHGGGHTKASAEKLKDGVAPAKYWRTQEGEFPFIIVSPHSKGMWNLDDLELFFEHIKATLPVDLSRVYLTGYSMGGAGTWYWAQAHPEHFSAIVPIAGGLASGGPKAITPDIDQWQENLKDMPTWIIHGADDTTVPPERSELMFEGLKDKNNKHVKLSILEGKGHAIVGRFKATPEIFDWFLGFQKD